MAIDPEIRRELQELKDGRLDVAGTVSLRTSPNTTTTVTRAVCSSSSVVLLMPLDAGARTEGLPQVTPAKGAFTLTHASSAGTRTYRYVIFTGRS